MRVGASACASPYPPRCVSTVDKVDRLDVNLLLKGENENGSRSNH